VAPSSRNGATAQLSILLKDCAGGDADAERQIFEIAYAHLKRMARGALRGEAKQWTLQPSMLVNEAFLRMPRAGEIDWKNRQHFFAVAARAMRRTIIDHAREQAAAKRPPRSQRVELDEQQPLTGIKDPHSLLLLDQALQELTAIDPRRARVVEMRFFAGMTHEEIAEVLRIDARTVKRDWQVAKLWLYDRLTKPR